MLERKEKIFPNIDPELFDRLLNPKLEIIYDAVENVDALKEYLSDAFASKIHPLGHLMGILGELNPTSRRGRLHVEG
jgi:hypothetical protein